jgi:integrase
LIIFAYIVLTHTPGTGEQGLARLTLRRIDEAECPPDKNQVLIWDDDVRGLGVRVTKSAKVFIYQSRLPDRTSGNGRKSSTFRIKIGNCSSILLDDARNIAKKNALLVSQGIDPRQERLRVAGKEATERQEQERQDLTLGEIWPTYCKERQSSWSEHYHLLHERLIHQGGEQRSRSKLKTVPGPLASLAATPLSQITTETIKSWVNGEKDKRPTQTRIAFEALKAFLTWCEDDQRYQGVSNAKACSTKIKKDHLPRTTSRDDCLQREQLKIWFDCVLRYESEIMNTYIQTLLLTGGRREEIMSLRWSDIDFKWSQIAILGKGAMPRDIPLTPYCASLLSKLPRTNEWVFSSKSSKSGRLQSPTKAFQKMMQQAEIKNLTLHGLRRSFSTLAEWIEAPAGIIAQIQGHQPSAIAERHYKKRPIDLLRVWHEKIEKWMVEEAGLVVPVQQIDSGI